MEQCFSTLHFFKYILLYNAGKYKSNKNFPILFFYFYKKYTHGKGKLLLPILKLMQGYGKKYYVKNLIVYKKDDN